MIEVYRDRIYSSSRYTISHTRFGFANKPNDLLVYRRFGQTAMLICLHWQLRYMGLDHDRGLS